MAWIYCAGFGGASSTHGVDLLCLRWYRSSAGLTLSG